MKHIYRVPVDTKHFEDTIEKGKEYTKLEEYFNASDREQLPTGKLHYWGSKPGTSNVKLFDQMKEGDEILFYRGKKYIASATIAYKTINPALAHYSWGEDNNGVTWELVYFLSNIKLLELDASILSQEWGMNMVHVMGFSKIADERAKPFIDKYGSVAQFIEQLETK